MKAPAWRYTPKPDQELRWYPKDAWHGWRPLGSPLTSDFDDIPMAEAQIAERILRTGQVSCYELTMSDSGDSWNAFSRRNRQLTNYRPWQPEHEYQRARQEKQANQPSRRQQIVAAEQAKWEAEQQARQRMKQRAADREWEQTAEQRRWDAARHRAKAQWQADAPPAAPKPWPMDQVQSLWFQKSHATVAYWQQLGFSKQDEDQSYVLICIDAPLFMIQPARAALDVPGGILFVPRSLADYLITNRAATQLSGEI